MATLKMYLAGETRVFFYSSNYLIFKKVKFNIFFINFNFIHIFTYNIYVIKCKKTYYIQEDTEFHSFSLLANRINISNNKSTIN